MSRINKLETIYKEQLTSKHIKDTSVFIQSVIDADITKGKYARFLIESFLNDKFLEEDLIGGLNSTVGQAIRLFDKHKSKLPIEKRSVYALNSETGEALYQSPGDLWNSVKQFQGELSGKELKREEQEKIYRETEFIYKDENTGFQIISPLTEDSAKWWGKGTRWCTSAEKNNQFKNYAKDAPLFILLMSDKQKLQLWNNDKIENNGNNIQFMDEADNTVSLDYIEQNWSVLEPICLWLNDLRFIPEKLKTPELCELAVKQNGRALDYVPARYKTKEFCKIAVSNNGYALKYIPNTFFKKYKDYNMCKIAVEQNGLSLEYVPEKLKTPELCELAVKQYGWTLEYVPEKLRTPNLCQLDVQQSRWSLQYVPEKLKTPEMCKLSVQKNGIALYYVPEELRTKELCELAVKQNGRALANIPEYLKTNELCKLAVKHNGLALQLVPLELKTKGLCELAVKQNGQALEYVPNKFKDELKHYVKDEAFELPIEKYQEIFQEIKTLFPKKDISLSYHSR